MSSNAWLSAASPYRLFRNRKKTKQSATETCPVCVYVFSLPNKRYKQIKIDPLLNNLPSSPPFQLSPYPSPAFARPSRFNTLNRV